MKDKKHPYSLPAEMATRDGQLYNPNDDRWSITSNTQNYNFNFDDDFYGSNLLNLFKCYVATLLQSKKVNYAYSAYQYIKRLISQIASYDGNAEIISALHVINYQSSLNREALYHITNCANYLSKWNKLGIPGVPTETVSLITEMPKHHRKKGMAVILRCPTTGAYSNLEFDGLYKALHSGFANGEVSLSDYALSLLSGSLAVRPVQAASLMVSDLHIDVSEGVTKYALHVPRAKQSKGDYRTHFTERPLTEEIGRIIEAQAKIVLEHASRAGIVDRSLTPLFPSSRSDATFFESKNTPTIPTSNSIQEKIKSTLRRLNVKSERTGEAINISATRARRTLGTRAAQAGKSLEQIAHILDHTSLTSAQCYIEISSDLMPRIDKKMALLLAPMAQRFAGTISKSRFENSGIHKHIFGAADLGGAPTDIGGCGKYGFCGLGKPTACYTCRLFHPWADAPHEAILDGLIERLDLIEANGSPMVASALEDTIVACAEVVRQCRELTSKV